MDTQTERRTYRRYALKPMYTSVRVRPLNDRSPTLKGHAYDISRGGVRFELDRRIEPGTPVTVSIELPGDHAGESRPVVAVADIVWLNEEDEIGPVRMSARFTRFSRSDGERRLADRLDSGAYSPAA